MCDMCVKSRRNLCSGEKLFVADGYHLFLYCKAISYESRYTLLKHGMNVWKVLCMEKMCSLIYQLRKEPMLY